MAAENLDQAPNMLKQNLKMADLVALSVSSVGPLFSIAATGGVMAANAGLWTIPSIGLIAIPFILASFIFRLLGQIRMEISAFELHMPTQTRHRDNCR